MRNIVIKKILPSKIERFAKRQWQIINRRFNHLPPKKTLFFGVYLKKLVAYAKLDIRGGMVEIRHLIVQDNLTGKGIGSQILNYIEKWAKRKKYRKIVLKVPSVYKMAINLYKAHGYKKDATLPDYYYGCDWCYMGKKL